MIDTDEGLLVRELAWRAPRELLETISEALEEFNSEVDPGEPVVALRWRLVVRTNGKEA